MSSFTCIHFMFLLFFLNNESAKSTFYDDDKNVKNFLCLLQNIDNSSLFYEQEKGNLENITASMSIPKHEYNKSRFQRINKEFALYLLRNTQTVPTDSLKFKILRDALKECFENTDNQELISYLRYLVINFSEEVIGEKVENEISLSNASYLIINMLDLSSRNPFAFKTANFLSPKVDLNVPYENDLKSNIVTSNKVVVYPRNVLSMKILSDLTKKFAHFLASSDVFRSVLQSGISSQMAAEIATLAVAESLSSVSVSSNISSEIEDSVQRAVLNLGDSVNVKSYAKEITSNIIFKLLSDGILTSENGYGTVSDLMNEYLKAFSSIASRYENAVLKNQTALFMPTASKPSTIISSPTADGKVFGFVSRNRSIRRKRESIDILREDLVNCADTYKINFENERKVWLLCRKVFDRGVWDEKADRTIDKDNDILIKYMYDNNRDNVGMILDFIDTYVPKHVRELIICYNTLINEFQRNDDFTLPWNKPLFQRIKKAVRDIKNMNGNSSEFQYAKALKRLKQMYENMLEILNKVEIIERQNSHGITYAYIVNCSNTVKNNIENETEIHAACSKFFNRGIWDEKADETLDRDIRKIIQLLFDSNVENLVKVLFFIQKYMPKYVREFIVSYDTVISELEGFRSPLIEWYLQHIKIDIENIRNMNGLNRGFNYIYAKQVYKDMLKDMLDKIPERSFSAEDENIKKCANSVKNGLENEFEISCSKIFNRTILDDKTDINLYRDIKKLVGIIYDNEVESIKRVLYFIENYIPKYLRERVLCYNAIIYELEKDDNFDVEVSQPYLLQIKEAVAGLISMNNISEAENPNSLQKTYRNMLENMVENLDAVAGNKSISISEQDIEKCGNSFINNSENELKIVVSCNKIFNRGVWDDKADNTLDEDIETLIHIIYESGGGSFIDVLYFIYSYVPNRVRDLIVSYSVAYNKFEQNENFNNPINQWYIYQMRKDVLKIKTMSGKHYNKNYNLTDEIYKDMWEEMAMKFNALPITESITVTDQDIENCANAAKDELENNPKTRTLCNKIFIRGIWDEKADRTLDGDIRKLMHLICKYEERNFTKVSYFVENYVPKYVRERIVSYDAIVNEYEDKNDSSLIQNEQIINIVAAIEQMESDNPAENYINALLIHKLMLESMLSKLKKLLVTESTTVEKHHIQNCAAAYKIEQDSGNYVIPWCRNIFERGIWDEKADRTLDRDIRMLMQLIFDNKAENLVKALYFIDRFVKRYVRELIVSYDTVVNEFMKTKDLRLATYIPQFHQIKESLTEIKHMNNEDPFGNYKHVKKFYKDMLQNILDTLNKVEKEERISLHSNIRRCADSIKSNSENESAIDMACNKIFDSGSGEENAIRILDVDIRKLMHLIYDNKRENLVKVLGFIEKYVPRRIREMLISYDQVINEFERKNDFNMPLNQPYLQHFKEAMAHIKSMISTNHTNDDATTRSLYKAILDNIFENLHAVSGKKSISIDENDLQKCSDSFKSNLNKELEVYSTCSKIFNRGVWDERVEGTLYQDIRKLMRLIHGHSGLHLIKVLDFIHLYVPKYIRELAMSYDAVFKLFHRNENYNMQFFKPVFIRIRKSITDIKNMYGGQQPVESYESSEQIYISMIDNALQMLNQIENGESTSIGYPDIVRCSNPVKFHPQNYVEIIVPCNKIFYRGVWDGKIDVYIDRDIETAINLMYDGNSKNISKVLNFIDTYVPKHIRELIVSYNAIINEFERTEDFSLPQNQPYFQQIYKAIMRITHMKGNFQANTYDMTQKTHKDILENIFKKFNAIASTLPLTKEQAIQNCIRAIQEKLSFAEDMCNEILKKEDNRKWFTEDVFWLESDVEVIVTTAYNGNRDNFENVLLFVRHKFPYFKQVAKGYKVLLNKMDERQKSDAVELTKFIAKVSQSISLEFDSSESKSILVDVIDELNKRLEILKENAIQNCIHFTPEEGKSNETKHCRQMLSINYKGAILQDYVKHVKEIIRRAYNGKLENLDIVLRLIEEQFPYSFQDVLGYSTLLDLIEGQTHEDLEPLKILLDKIKSSIMLSLLPLNNTKNEYEALRKHIEQLIINKEEKLIEIFAKAIHANNFTEEETVRWEQLYGKEDNFTMDCITCSNVEKLIVRMYDNNTANFDHALKAIDRFHFVEQKVKGLYTLLKEMEKFHHMPKEALKILEGKSKEIEINELSDYSKIKFVDIKIKVNGLLDGNIDDGQECVNDIRSKDLKLVKFHCSKVLLSIASENSTKTDFVDFIVTTTYDKNLLNVDPVLGLIYEFPYAKQRLNGYNILLSAIKNKGKDSLYFSSLNKLKEKIKTDIQLRYKYFQSDVKKKFERIRRHLKELISRFISKKQNYSIAQKSLTYWNETIINVDNVDMRIIVHYDVPLYFSESSFQNELLKIQKEARKCIDDYKDFVLPKGWKSNSREVKVNVWIFNDQDIFNHRVVFTRFDGIYLYRNQENRELLQNFKHGFMHVLLRGGIGNRHFVASVPRWFLEGFSELAELGPCNLRHLHLLKKYMKDTTFEKTHEEFIDMTSLTAEQQKKKYPRNYLLNYFMSYFAVLHLMNQHSEFLQQVMEEVVDIGWEGQDRASSSPREKLFDHFIANKDAFYMWMENSSKNFSFCYSDEPREKVKMAYISRRYESELTDSVYSDGKLFWGKLTSAFNKNNIEIIDQEVEFQRETLKKVIEDLNLIPFEEHLEKQEIVLNTILRFLNEIHSRREDISTAFYYYYANSLLKLAFEDIIIPVYQRASLEKDRTSWFKSEIQYVFERFMQDAFTKDVPPDTKLFLKWYQIRCQTIDFCTSYNNYTIPLLLENLAGNSEHTR